MKRQIIVKCGVLFLLILDLAGGVRLISQDQFQQEEDAFLVRTIHELALGKGQCYKWLTDMATQVGPRLSGSAEAAEAVRFTKRILDSLNLDSVWLQPVTVPRWERGETEQCRIHTATGENFRLRALALGNSIGSGPDGVRGQVLEVLSLDELRGLPDEDVRGRIVFFNRPFDETLVNVFNAYGRAVDQRSQGPVLAAQKGAAAAVVRSMTPSTDTIPHTGGTTFVPEGPNVPAIAISTVDADHLSILLKTSPIEMFLRTTCAFRDSVTSYNVIGQINGREKPDEILLVGGHLDSWDVGHGAHDDGSGCVQSMDVMYLLNQAGYQPRRTVRCVLFMNEENGLQGGKKYASTSDAIGEFHLAAIESDAGGFRPLGFGISANGTAQQEYYRQLHEWWGLLEPYYLSLSIGGGGADISALKGQGGMLIGMIVNRQRYFDYHHTHEDTIDKVHPRELKLGAAAMTSLLILIDKYTSRFVPNE